MIRVFQVILSVLLLKLFYPDDVFVVRGNHEDYRTNKVSSSFRCIQGPFSVRIQTERY